MKAVVVAIASIGLASCATMRESITLGTGMGAAAGGAAAFAGLSAAGQPMSVEQLALGMGMGAGIGAITSYFTHKETEASWRNTYSRDVEMHFGDLPPNPFMLPRNLNGSRR